MLIECNWLRTQVVAFPTQVDGSRRSFKWQKGTVLSKKAEAKGQELYAKSLELSTRFDDNFMELARNLRSLQETDFDRFKDLIDKSGLGRRKAYYLVALDKALGNVKISKQRLASSAGPRWR